jgi:hypothetical protein
MVYRNDIQRAYIVAMICAVKRCNFFLPPQIISAIKSIAETTGLSLSEIVRHALINYIRNEKKAQQ